MLRSRTRYSLLPRMLTLFRQRPTPCLLSPGRVCKQPFVSGTRFARTSRNVSLAQGGGRRTPAPQPPQRRSCGPQSRRDLLSNGAKPIALRDLDLHCRWRLRGARAVPRQPQRKHGVGDHRRVRGKREPALAHGHRWHRNSTPPALVYADLPPARNVEPGSVDSPHPPPPRNGGGGLACEGPRATGPRGGEGVNGAAVPHTAAPRFTARGRTVPDACATGQ